MLSFSQALSAETRGSAVAVTALCPGPTRTGFVDALDANVSQTAVYKNLADPEPVVNAGLQGSRSWTTGRGAGVAKLVDGQRRPHVARLDGDANQRADVASGQKVAA